MHNDYFTAQIITKLMHYIILQMKEATDTEIFPWRVAKVVKKNQKLMPTMEEDDM